MHRAWQVHVRVHDRLGLVVYDESFDRELELRVYPGTERLRSMLQPADTQLPADNHVSRRKGDGIEFADLRAFISGDRVQRINWRATARRGELLVNERHPEQASDVVLLLDTFAAAGHRRASTLDLALRAAAAVATAHLEHRDRVGLIRFGGVVGWLPPGMGPTQAYLIAEALLEAEVVLSFADKSIELVPPRMLPAGALVVAISPLLDERATTAIFDLRARGFDVAVIEISPFPHVPATPGLNGQLAYRLWRLRRANLRASFEELGVGIVEWHDGVPLQDVIEEVAQFRRHAGRVLA